MSIIANDSKVTLTHAHRKMLNMRGFTDANTCKFQKVSRRAQLQVNTPTRCMSLIRQFGGEKKKEFPFYLGKKKESTQFHLRKNGAYLFAVIEFVLG